MKKDEFDFCKFSGSKNELQNLKKIQDYIENCRDETQPFIISATSSGGKDNSSTNLPPFSFKINKEKMTKAEINKHGGLKNIEDFRGH